MRSYRVLVWPLAAAAVAHAAIGWSMARNRPAPIPGSGTVLAVSLLPLPSGNASTEPGPTTKGRAGPAPSEVPDRLRSSRHEADGLPAEVDRRRSVIGEPPLPVDGTGAAAEVLAGPVAVPAMSQGKPASPDGVESPPSAPLTRFYRTSELTQLPALPGVPLINLGEDAAIGDGSLALELFIDEEGHVVESRLESSDLPVAVTERLVGAFASYPYLPGQLEGRAVKSRVVLVIGVTGGQAVVQPAG